ncbi:D-glycero-beta-D-manno-heptose 1,7-bisphosphate 7-phosphatase [Glaesserella parasuis]|uniref:D-glycero-beta-D-manno-heptose 1,7-bisphosphate 7-phosphatase n=1 Tax=Glaesserella parasuis TaxID=738 RepID=UPI0002C96806|nr:D-glycero-beta-D-manno-heptose 1,7-bisphosphate 7-phosphatase [Glaesserella parasuis]EMY45907.1 D,D-heptose 1,7-bisphosphate phosphatase [Glaesserella parasuis gx033]MCT8546544.1 D-glycero-beta-D-manno-heptose 1,7-bisphosphate 7-phosphatase [Glaesserella parasuis]MCT8550913.1 D-glycero-beta-D-manno-heptose 1,7-bisphosphate 7-phosphatase [Glaesserella parasuis]MCT8592972.1 D-glycero-beta-D-manno-heptose 1,7-bisphosphate 7-phosphatase [Glaesserella parasuis]MDE3998165.1 D-glycero-beta-D-manno
MANKAIFLDRDGTINIDHGYVHNIDDFRFIKGVGHALKQLQDKGYMLVIVTNQSGIARGYFSEAQFHQLTEWMDWSLDEDYGVVLDGIYYCPHHPEGIANYKKACDCRKPKAGLLLQAISDLDIDPSKSIMVGDKLEDILAAKNAGVKVKILVRTGKPITPEGELNADYVIDSVADLPKFIDGHVDEMM